MSYTGTGSQVGSQVLFNINTTGSTYVVVGEVVDFTLSGTQVKLVSATNLQSTVEEYVPALANGGKASITYNRVSTDAGQVQLMTNFGAKTKTNFKVTLVLAVGQTTTADSYALTGYIESVDELASVKADGIIQGKATIQLTAVPVLTEGA